MIIKKVNIRNGGEKLPDFWERNVVYPSLSPSLCSAVPPLLHSAKLVKGLDSSTMKPCSCNRCRVWFNVILQKCARPSTRTGEFVALKPVCTFHFSNSDSSDHTTVFHFASEKKDGGVSGSSSHSASSLHL